MDSASRHAQRLASNFLDDLDDIQRTSRARDRRAMSQLETGVEQPLPRIRSTSRRTPAPFVRLTSVPPQSSSTYRPVYHVSEVGLPPVVPRTYRTNRYFTETPQYRSTYRVQTPIQKRRTYTTQYSAGESPVTYRYTYSYPSEHTYQSPVTRAYSYTNLSPEVTSERRRIERRMDDLLNYKLPPPDYYHGLRGSLRSLQDKMDTHKRLIDRYVGIDMNTVPTSVEERIESKCQQLSGRMPEFRSHGPALETSKLETQLYYESPQTTLGYGEGIMKPMGGQISELRGRIKRLLCRSKHDPHYFRF